jgi:cell division septation protein DedD
LAGQGFDVYTKEWTDPKGNIWHVIRVGHLSDRSTAGTLAQQLTGRTGKVSEVLSAR